MEAPVTQGTAATRIASDSFGPMQAVQRDFPALVMMGRLMLLGVVAAVVLGVVWLALRKKQ